MENTGKRLQYLFQQYLSNRINGEEYTELWELLQDETTKNILPDELQALWEHSTEDKPLIPADEWHKKLQRLIRQAEAAGHKTKAAGKIPGRRSYQWKAAAAAAIILLVAGGLYLHNRRSSSKKLMAANNKQQHDILPGGNKAALILSNGATIILDSTANGLITRQGNARVSKSGNGKIIYNPVNSNAAEVVYNTLRTPRGGQYRLILPDGSKVWLDAASSIRFPTSFSGKERVVEITGEAYFEVAAHASRPFIVSVDGMKIKVLGTHFNVMAYDDEPAIKTTLLEGAISISKGTATTLLAPGQQAQVDKEGKIILVRHVDTNEVTAWKNHLFWFDDDDIQTVMRQVSRWYNVNVVINGSIPQHFTGSIPRDVNVSRVFKVLQETDRIHFKIADKKIIVTP